MVIETASGCRIELDTVDGPGHGWWEDERRNPAGTFVFDVVHVEVGDPVTYGRDGLLHVLPAGEVVNTVVVSSGWSR